MTLNLFEKLRFSDGKEPEIGVKIAVAVAMVAILSGCKTTKSTLSVSKAEVNHSTKFSSAAYGVAASPRLTVSKQVKKGGGRSVVGKPYKIKGKWYHPKEDPNYDKTGLASWYGPNFHGRLTANGEIYDQYHLSAAHPTFPLPSYARVTNRDNGRSVIVRVNDRGPYAHGRIIDLSSKAADLLNTKQKGVANVRVQYLGRAPLHGQDMSYLMASYHNGDGGAISNGNIQFASNDTNSPFNNLTRNSMPTPKIKQHRDLLTLVGGKNVYVPTGEITGTVKPAQPALKTASAASAKTARATTPSPAPASATIKSAQKPTVLASVLETKAVKAPVKKKLTSDLLKKFYLRRKLK